MTSPENQAILGHGIDDTWHGKHGAEHSHREPSGGADGHHSATLGGIDIGPHLHEGGAHIDVIVWHCKERRNKEKKGETAVIIMLLLDLQIILYLTR